MACSAHYIADYSNKDPVPFSWGPLIEPGDIIEDDPIDEIKAAINQINDNNRYCGTDYISVHSTDYTGANTITCPIDWSGQCPTDNDSAWATYFSNDCKLYYLNYCPKIRSTVQCFPLEDPGTGNANCDSHNGSRCPPY